MKRLFMAAILAALLVPGFARAGEWYEKLKLKGDFRHRHEFIQEEGKEDRTRWRIRARLGIAAEISESWSFQGRFATGSDDPVSTNQTLTDGFTKKGFNLDQAYFDFHPAAVKGLHLRGGKMENPFISVEGSELIWDGDLTPEGAAATYENAVNEKVTVMVDGGLFSVTERKADKDTWLAGGQAAVKAKPTKEVHFIAGGGYYDYQEVKGREGIYSPGNFFGNTTMLDADSNVVYAYDFNLAEGFGVVGVDIEKVSVKLYGDYVVNTEADTLDQGYLFGASLQYGKGKNSVKVFGNYRKVEDNAVIGAFNDSDFIGGGTNGKGFKFGGSYGVTDKVSLGVSYFLNKKGIEDGIDYKRLQADLLAKF